MSTSLRLFAGQFFTEFGAEVYPDGKEMLVQLPPNLLEVFGKQRLYLVFPDESGESRPLSAKEDVLAYGSRTFDLMMRLLHQRGEMSHFALEQNMDDALTLAEPNPVSKKTQLSVDDTRRTKTRFVAINYRLIFMSDESQERFKSIVLDNNGRRWPKLEPLFQQGIAFDTPPLRIPITVDLLRNQLDRATQFIQQAIQPDIESIQAESEKRFRGAAQRLTRFYQTLLADVNSGNAEQDEATQADLQSELAHKLADERERFRLNVTVTPLSYALATVPLGQYQLNWQQGQHTQPLTLLKNLHNGQYLSLTCQTCKSDVLARLIDPQSEKTCQTDCPLSQEWTLWATLAALGQTTPASAVPNLPTLNVNRYQWWHLSLSEHDVFIGQGRWFWQGGILLVCPKEVGDIVQKEVRWLDRWRG